ncbi:hypothetical protein GCM10025868_33610 [Angustibacter aerolatus]|uniref:Uncharacterized protein n=1 Tax=Angustibacter aerolatus TaxID=1162965 RepID=A0ABQ6JKM8_9ACTN|nr:hypothetical protein GCM10025868_33610 [Angustibacter aerolatus]
MRSISARLRDATGHGRGVAGTVDDRGVVLADHDAAGGAQVLELDLRQAEADLLADDLRAGEGRDVAEHGLATVAEAGAFTATALKVPRILFTTMVDSASPSTSSATTNSGLPVFTTFSSSGRKSCSEPILAWCTST